MGDYKYEERKLKKYLGKELCRVFKKYNCIVAGGSVLSIFSNTEINDIDVYFRNARDLADFLYNEMNGKWVIAYTKKAILFKVDDVEVQAIYFKYFENAENLFETFDFTVCMAAYDFKEDEFVLHKDFLRHNVSKFLKFNSNTAYPIVSALRVDKYKKKGFNISKAEFLRIMLTINNLEIKTYEELKDQMGGMYGEDYDSLLEPKEGEELDIPEVIEKISEIGERAEGNEPPCIGNVIEDFEEFVFEVTNEKIKCFEHDGVCFTLQDGEIIRITGYRERYYEVVNVDEVIQFPLKRFKFVKRNKDGKLVSFHDEKFEWKEGENVKIKDHYKGIFASSADDLHDSYYANEKEKVCIELLVEKIEDFMDFGSLSEEYKRLVMTRVVTKEETEKIMTGR